MPLAFHHLAIQCADLAACEAFYRDVLGLSVLRRWPREGGGDRSVWLAMGDGHEQGFVALERAEEAPAPRPWRDGSAGLHLVALRIAPGERRAWEDRLEAAGVLVVHRTRWTIYFHDPEGNPIGLTHYPHDGGSAEGERSFPEPEPDRDRDRDLDLDHDRDIDLDHDPDPDPDPRDGDRVLASWGSRRARLRRSRRLQAFLERAGDPPLRRSYGSLRRASQPPSRG